MATTPLTTSDSSTSASSSLRTNYSSSSTSSAVSRGGGTRLAATHLFDYVLPSREDTQQGHHHHRNSHHKKHSALSASHHHRPPEAFLRANCRFVISPTPLAIEFIKRIQIDPNTPLEWKVVEQVRLMQEEGGIINCPICLESPPRVARITPCGHVYCWHCILQYLDLCHKCPICFEHVTEKLLRPVLLVVSKILPLEIGEELEMKLLIRNKGSICPNNTTSLIPSVCEEGQEYCRFVWSTLEFRNELHGTEVSNVSLLLTEAALDADKSQMPFILRAQELLRESKLPSNLLMDEPKIIAIEENQDFYKFYQAIGGEYVILHPFNMKCLSHEFAEKQLPILLPPNVKVLSIEHVVLTQSNVRKYRFLSHLPLYCEFHIVELDISSVLSRATKSFFAAEFKSRAKTRRSRRLKEKALTKKAKSVTSASLPYRKPPPEFDFCQSFNVEPPPTESTNEEVTNPILKSFATITVQNGYFPSLSESPPPARSSAARTGVWGSAQQDHDLPPPPPAKTKGTNRRKKKTTLLSTAGRQQRRN